MTYLTPSVKRPFTVAKRNELAAVGSNWTTEECRSFRDEMRAYSQNGGIPQYLAIAEYSAHFNIFTDSDTLATQTIELVPGNYTMSFGSGSGSITSSNGTGTASFHGAVNVGQTRTITVTAAGTFTFTVVGQVTNAMLVHGSVTRKYSSTNSGGGFLSVGRTGVTGQYVGSTGSVGTMITHVDNTIGRVINQPAVGDGTHGINTEYKPKGFDEAFTAHFWYNPADTTGPKRVISFQNGAAGVVDILFVDAEFRGRALTNSGNYIGRIAPGALSAGWAMYSVVYDQNTDTASDITLYKNGVQVDTADMNTGTFTGVPEITVDPIQLTAYNPNQSNVADGLFDYMALDDRAISAAQILALYEAQRTRFGV